MQPKTGFVVTLPLLYLQLSLESPTGFWATLSLLVKATISSDTITSHCTDCRKTSMLSSSSSIRSPPPPPQSCPGPLPRGVNFWPTSRIVSV